MLHITKLLLLPSFAIVAPHPQTDFLHFSIQLPTGLRLIDISPKMMDFNIYKIIDHNDRAIARLYVGNHPDTKINLVKLAPGSKAAYQACAESEIDSKHYELILKFDKLTNSPWSCIHLFGVTSNPKLRALVISSVKNVVVKNGRIE